jgi:ArsR family transcriptional regulator
MTELFKALSDETRLRILSLVWEDELCVCEIEACLGLTQSNASRHLTALKNAGLLSVARRAQWSYYKLSDAFVRDNGALAEYLGARLKALLTYSADMKKARECRDSDLCQCK